MRIGLIARSDNTGLGNQTKELADMLKPDKILIIDASLFNRNVQYHNRYSEYNCKISRGAPSNTLVNNFLNHLDVVISCETFYNPQFVKLAKLNNVKTILQYNYELLDYLTDSEALLPDVLLAPSMWMLDDIKNKFGDKCRVQYLPPPTNPTLFKDTMNLNIEKKHKRILHIGGKPAMADRNGTNVVLDMLNYSKAEYELVIATQVKLKSSSDDPRLKVSLNNVKDRQNMYKNFDAMILPRRYAGLCLPMNEALLSGLPVFMTDISPNNIILPEEWLVRSEPKQEILTRTKLKVYEANAEQLAKKIDNYINSNDNTKDKKLAYEIGIKNFAVQNLKDKYFQLINSL
jgi:hypothetical protein